MLNSLLVYSFIAIVVSMIIALLFTGFAIALEYSINPLSLLFSGVAIL